MRTCTRTGPFFLSSNGGWVRFKSMNSSVLHHVCSFLLWPCCCPWFCEHKSPRDTSFAVTLIETSCRCASACLTSILAPQTISTVSNNAGRDGEATVHGKGQHASTKLAVGNSDGATAVKDPTTAVSFDYHSFDFNSSHTHLPESIGLAMKATARGDTQPLRQQGRSRHADHHRKLQVKPKITYFVRRMASYTTSKLLGTCSSSALRASFQSSQRACPYSDFSHTVLVGLALSRVLSKEANAHLQQVEIHPCAMSRLTSSKGMASVPATECDKGVGVSCLFCQHFFGKTHLMHSPQYLVH